MIVIMKPGISEEVINHIIDDFKIMHLGVHTIKFKNKYILVLEEDISEPDLALIQSIKEVENVIRMKQPYIKANRLIHPDDTVISVNGKEIGGKKIAMFAGPCSVESEEQILYIAQNVKKSGADFLRGGAFKPRTSPYSFQGLRENGLELMKMAREKTGLPIVSEIMSCNLIDKFVEDVDIIQVGARNMQNFELLKELGKTNKPILLKRGLAATIEELLMSAEYIMSNGNENVILCERGIRTFETSTRNTLDISAIPVIKKLSHLPVIVDPSHASGEWWLVEPLAKAAVAAGADGLIIEVHNDPANAKCDGQQSIMPKRFDFLMHSLRNIAIAVGREI